LRLAIDATPVVPGRKGLGVVLEGFLDEVEPRHQAGSCIVYVDHTFEDEARRRWPSMDVRSVRARPAMLWEQVLLPRRARCDGADLLLTGRDRTLGEPKVTTVVYLFEVPDHRTRALLDSRASKFEKAVASYSLRRFRTIAGRVSHFIVGSQATAKELREIYGVRNDRTHVVYPGLSERFRPPENGEAKQAQRDRFCGGRRYVLHFATGDPRENTNVALRSFAAAASHAAGAVALLLAGVRAADEALLTLKARELGIGGRTFFLGRVDESALVSVYQGAEAYLDPTLYEGFGLQLAEAMACGVPVISSNVASVPEVVGEEGLLFDPHDENGFASALLRVLSDAESRVRLVEQGTTRAALFTWPEAATRILELLERFSHERKAGMVARDGVGGSE
jgi:glycosyltransferase involved in cell wall biosynthesis